MTFMRAVWSRQGGFSGEKSNAAADAAVFFAF
jgi:hypothetical protein